MAQPLLLKEEPRPGELRADERVLADSRAHSHAEPVEGRSAAHTIGNWTLANRAPAGVFVLSSVQILRQTSTDREMRKGPAGFGWALGLIGGANRDRTGDLYNAIVALSQLSYGPRNRWRAADDDAGAIP